MLITNLLLQSSSHCTEWEIISLYFVKCVSYQLYLKINILFLEQSNRFHIKPTAERIFEALCVVLTFANSVLACSSLKISDGSFSSESGIRDVCEIRIFLYKELVPPAWTSWLHLKTNATPHKVLGFPFKTIKIRLSQSQWSRGLMAEMSSFARTLGSNPT
jgi:hypothetical protein